VKISTPTLISSAMTAAAIAVAPAAHAVPTVAQQCDAQAWPRPVPDVVGMMFDPAMKQVPAGTSGGALACWDTIRAVTQDGHDAAKEIGGWDTITAISPAPGTPVGRHDPITVALAPMNDSAPATFHPCDWVTTGEVADIFGIAGPVKTDGYVPPGSVEPHCIYRSPGYTAVSTTLYVTGAFPVDAAAEYARSADSENTTEISGLGRAARCITDLHGAQDRPYSEVVVLLGGDRMLEAKGLGAQPCDQLTQFAETAINRL
jgi:hypothetical protein